MKIAYIIKSLAQSAGTERIMIDKMNYLSEELGYEIYAITYEQGEHKLAFSLSPKVKHIDLNTKFYTLKRLNKIRLLTKYIKMRADFAKRLKRNIKTIKPDILICTTYSDFLIDIISNMHIYSKILIEAHVSKSAIEYKNKWNSSFLGKKIGSIIDKYIERKISHCAAFVTLTRKDAQSWSTIKKAHVIPNFLSYYPPIINVNHNSNQIISVGRLDPQKGYDLLLKAWVIVQKRINNWKLNIYGAGGEEEKLLNIIKENNLNDSVEIHKPNNQIYNQYMKNSFYVMSSRYEGFGLVLIEAMSCGIPCISFDCPNGPSDIITNGIDGILVENGNIEKLAENICYMINNKDERIRMGEKSRQNIVRYLPENIIPLWIDLFNTILKIN